MIEMVRHACLIKIFMICVVFQCAVLLLEAHIWRFIQLLHQQGNSVFGNHLLVQFACRGKYRFLAVPPWVFSPLGVPTLVRALHSDHLLFIGLFYIYLYSYYITSGVFVNTFFEKNFRKWDLHSVLQL